MMPRLPAVLVGAAYVIVAAIYLLAYAPTRDVAAALLLGSGIVLVTYAVTKDGD